MHGALVREEEEARQVVRVGLAASLFGLFLLILILIMIIIIIVITIMIIIIIIIIVSIIVTKLIILQS